MNLPLILFSPLYLENGQLQNYKRKLSYFWIIQSGVGVAGTVLNSFVLWIFYKERQGLNTSINTMTRCSFSSNIYVNKHISIISYLFDYFSSIIIWQRDISSVQVQGVSFSIFQRQSGPEARLIWSCF